MLTEFVKHLQASAVTDHIDAARVDPLLTPDNMSLHSLERYNLNRYRERYTMRTSSIQAYIDYVNTRTDKKYEDVSIVSIDPDECVSRCIFNSYDRAMDEPGHCDDTATCRLKALPMWACLIGLFENEQTYSQRWVIDLIKDWHDYMPDATKLVSSFSKLTIEGLSKVDATEKDFSRERTAMEKIDMKADGGEVPTDINVVFNPYDGFEERQLDIGVSAKLDRNDEIKIRLRVRGFERLKLLIAEEFATKLVSGLSEAPIIGTIEPA